MCLEKVIETFKPNDDIIMGYKVYIKETNGKYLDYMQEEFRKIGKHYKAKGAALLGYDDNKLYDCGFHVFKTKKNARDYLNSSFEDDLVICKVHLWDIRAIGEQDNAIIYVGKNLRIVEEV